MRHWTPAEKSRHAAVMREKIKNWAPWAQSTGPKTQRGKTRSSRNALKHGMRSKGARRLTSLFERHRIFLRTVYQTLKHHRKTTNELIKQQGRAGTILPVMAQNMPHQIQRTGNQNAGRDVRAYRLDGLL
jgi:hypothetical protein